MWRAVRVRLTAPLGDAAAALDAGVEWQNAAVGALAGGGKQDALGVTQFGHDAGLRLGAAPMLPHQPEPR